MAVLSSPISLIQSIPPVTRVFTAVTIVSSGFHAWMHWKGLGMEADEYMLVVPGSTMFHPWTLVTSVFVEPNIFEFVASLLFVPPALKYLERLWGSFETVKFIAVAVGISNIIAFAFNWIEFIVTRNADIFLYGMQYHGQMALQIAILVAFTQLIPEHHVQVLGVLKARVKTLPMAYLTLSTVLCFVGFQCPWIIIQFGWFVGWIYLRFYKKNTTETVGGTDTYGDRSETFSLLSWFPPFVHYPLNILGTFVYSLATRFHLIPSSSSDIEVGIYTQTPGGARAEAERRRAMALKALDQRLANNSSPAGSHSTNANSSQPPRQPPSVLAEAPISSSTERQKSMSDPDFTADAGKTKVDV